ncbi:MAG: hypothetical protein HYS32_00520 [Candidatus Woesearchaeota archaeon]|nr:MAG: hypothetical protein HYS32_00520 [Candidatus Woesearchaeota archaeon]
MVTTIQISEDLAKELKERKFRDSETYEEVIWDLIENTLELSEETKNDIEKSRREIKEGKTKSLAQIKKELGI